jgi:hypothetical protein
LRYRPDRIEESRSVHFHGNARLFERYARDRMGLLIPQWTQNAAYGVDDFFRLHLRGGHLVKQRKKRVIVVVVNQEHMEIRMRERARGP